ncbi:MAG: MgtC/SapB family protein, partial [Pseudomonadales bacterium]
ERAGVSAADMSRVVQGVVTGVGFLGTGAIIKRRSEEEVQGLTTAAGIWMTAALGVACGLGHAAIAILGTLLALAILALLPHAAPASIHDSDGK